MKKYRVDLHENFTVSLYGDIVIGFAAVPGADLVDVMRDVVAFLKENNLSKEYSLSVEGKTYKISQFLFQKSNYVQAIEDNQIVEQSNDFGV